MLYCLVSIAHVTDPNT